MSELEDNLYIKYLEQKAQKRFNYINDNHSWGMI